MSSHALLVPDYAAIPPARTSSYLRGLLVMPERDPILVEENENRGVGASGELGRSPRLGLK